MEMAYQEIMNLSEEEAQAAGYITDSASPEYYKTQAQNWIRDLKKMSNRWEELNAKYGFNDDEHLSNLPRFMFGLENDIESLEQLKKDLGEQIQTTKDSFSRGESFYIVSYAQIEEFEAEQQSFNVKKAKLEEKLSQLARLVELTETKKEVGPDGSTIDLVSQYKARNWQPITKRLRGEAMDLARRQRELKDQKDAVIDTIVGDGTAQEAVAGYTDWKADHETYAETMKALHDLKAEAEADSSEYKATLDHLQSRKGRREWGKSFNDELKRLKQRIADKAKGEIEAATTPEEVDRVVDQIGDPEIVAASRSKKAKLKHEKTRHDRNMDRELDELSEGYDNPPTPPEPDEPELDDIVGEEIHIPDATKEDVAFWWNVINDPTKFTDPDDVQRYLKFLLNNYKKVPKEFIERVTQRIKEMRSGITPNTDADTGAEDVDAAADQDPGEERAPFSPKQGDVRREGDEAEGAANEEPDASGDLVFQFDKKLVIQGASAVASLAKEYATEGSRQVKYTVSADFLTTYAPELVIPGAIKPGDTLTIEVEEDFDKTINGERVTYQSLVDKHKAAAWKYAPMKIVHNGVTLGYVHDVDWIDAEMPGSMGTEAKNVVTKYRGADNWKIQKTRILKIRKVMWDLRRVETKIDKLSLGILSKNLAYNESGEVRSDAIEFKSLSASGIGADIRLVIYRRGIPHIAGKAQFRDSLVGNTDWADGRPLMAIPTNQFDANGKKRYLLMPVWLPTLGQAGIADSVMQTITTYLGSSKPEMEAIGKALGEDFGPWAPKSFVSYISQFLFSESFSPATFSNPKAKSTRVYFHISEKTGFIDIGAFGGIIYSTNPAHMSLPGYAPLMDNQKEVLVLFKKAQLNVQVDKMNSSKAESVVLEFSKDQPPYPRTQRYRTLLWENLETNLAGTKITDRSNNTHTVYFEQPVVLFDTEFSEQRPIGAPRPDPTRPPEAPPQATPSAPAAPTGKKNPPLPSWVKVGSRATWVADGVEMVTNEVITQVWDDPKGQFVLFSGTTTPVPVSQLEKPLSWVNQNARTHRKEADSQGVSAEMEQLFADGRTVGEVVRHMDKKHPFFRAKPVEDKEGWVVSVRHSMGIPSRGTEEGKKEFDAWLTERNRTKGDPNRQKTPFEYQAIANRLKLTDNIVRLYNGGSTVEAIAKEIYNLSSLVQYEVGFERRVEFVHAVVMQANINRMFGGPAPTGEGTDTSSSGTRPPVPEAPGVKPSSILLDESTLEGWEPSAEDTGSEVVDKSGYVPPEKRSKSNVFSQARGKKGPIVFRTTQDPTSLQNQSDKMQSDGDLSVSCNT
jgi:hypothetical protein